MKLYPNPVADFLQIDFNGNILAVRITDLSGRTVMKSKSNSRTLNMSFLPAGVYVIAVTTQNETQTFKIIKQ